MDAALSTDLRAKLSAGWPDLHVDTRLVGGHRNAVWSAMLGDERVVVRQSRRSLPSLEWELQLLLFLPTVGIQVADPIPTSSGSFHIDAFVVQRWIDGDEPASAHEWERVAAALKHLHSVVLPMGQRPGCCSVTELGVHLRSVDADLVEVPDDVRAMLLDVFAEFSDVPVSVIHGDPCASNLRLGQDGLVTFLDWDESRVDLSWHDLSNLGAQVLNDDQHHRAQRLSNAWEAVNAWKAEPQYARQRLAMLA